MRVGGNGTSPPFICGALRPHGHSAYVAPAVSTDRLATAQPVGQRTRPAHPRIMTVTGTTVRARGLPKICFPARYREVTALNGLGGAAGVNSAAGNPPGHPRPKRQ